MGVDRETFLTLTPRTLQGVRRRGQSDFPTRCLGTFKDSVEGSISLLLLTDYKYGDSSSNHTE
jgi:hypothetical protein